MKSNPFVSQHCSARTRLNEGESFQNTHRLNVIIFPFMNIQKGGFLLSLIYGSVFRGPRESIFFF